MKIKHFGGIEYANNISEFSEILQKKYGYSIPPKCFIFI